jgi:hypothetical protein
MGCRNLTPSTLVAYLGHQPLQLWAPFFVIFANQITFTVLLNSKSSYVSIVPSHPYCRFIWSDKGSGRSGYVQSTKSERSYVEDDEYIWFLQWNAKRSHLKLRLAHPTQFRFCVLFAVLVPHQYHL